MVLSRSSVAAEIHLFNIDPNGRSVPVSNYDEIVGNLKKHDVLIFTNGFRVTIDSQLKAGSQTKVFSILENSNEVLRLPLSTEKVESTEQFVLGNQILAQHRVRVPHINSFKTPEYAVVQKIKHFVTFHDFISNFNSYAYEIKNEAITAMDRFVLSTAELAIVADLHSENLVYDFSKKEWLVLDSDATVIPVNFAEDLRWSRNVLSDLDVYEMPKDVYSSYQELMNRWSSLITERRQQIRKNRLKASRVSCEILFSFP